MEMELSWADLTYEALVEIFKRLDFEDLYLSVPLVCKAWCRASMDSACWERVNMEDCFRKREETSMWWEPSFEKKMDYMVKLVVDRSRGNLRELSTRHCSNAALCYLATRCVPITPKSCLSASLYSSGVCFASLEIWQKNSVCGPFYKCMVVCVCVHTKCCRKLSRQLEIPSVSANC